MSALFGEMSRRRDINSIVTDLMESATGYAGSEMSEVEAKTFADTIRDAMYGHSGVMFNEAFEDMRRDDADSVRQLFLNSITENQNMSGASALSETALMPNLRTLTASIATTMRTPYEAVLHRLFDTRTLDKQTVDIEEVIPLVRAPFDAKAEDLIDAMSPHAPVPFVDRTEMFVEELTGGVTLPTAGVRNMPVLVGKDPLLKVNRDLRVSKIDVQLDGAPEDPANPGFVNPKAITFVRGSVPYFDARDNHLSCMFNVKMNDDTTTVIELDAKFNFDDNTLVYLRGHEAIKKVYFYATVSHMEHTHPIHTSFENRFEQFLVPTRPHIEVSLPQEMRTDIANSIQHFSDVDIVTAMTENITVISSRMEDQRLKAHLNQGFEYYAQFPFEAPQNYAYGNLEWMKREFIPFLDQCALKLKDEWNITDCHFRVGVSPYILRIIETDYSMDKSMTEDSKGSGVINYSIGVKTSTSVFYFISSQQFDDAEMLMLLIPNNFKMSQVKTYNYFRYSSFLTDQLRRSDNTRMPAIVYSERNLPIVFKALATKIEIPEMPTKKTAGPRFIRRVTI